MEFNDVRDNVPESKSRVLTEPAHSEVNKQLAEDGPAKTGEKKSSPFRKFLSNLWGPMRG